MSVMQRVVAWIVEHRRRLAVALVALALLLPISAHALGGGDKLVVAATAPEHGETMSVSIGTRGGVFDTCGGEATVEISQDGFIEYPASVGTFEVSGCRGEVEIPYDRFADKNGNYLVTANYDGKTATTRVTVNKVVNWVYVRSFEEPEEERTRIDVAFDRTLGQPLTSSVFSSGTLVVDIVYEQCTSDATLSQVQEALGQETCADANTGDNVFHAEMPIEDRASAVIFIPWENLDQETDDDEDADEGWYNVTATYHNEEAQANSNVPMDPTVYNEDPPGNWFEVDYR